jgi:cytochrome c oxidase subunit 2
LNEDSPQARRRITLGAAAFGLAPAAIAQQSQGIAAQTTTAEGQAQDRAAPAAAQTAMPSPALTGAPTEASGPSTAATPSAETTDVPAYSSSLTPKENIGQPDGRMGIQDQVTPIGREAKGFHDYILMPAIVIIT